MTAAVSDYRPAEQHATKLKRTPDPRVALARAEP